MIPCLALFWAVGVVTAVYLAGWAVTSICLFVRGPYRGRLGLAFIAAAGWPKLLWGRG